MRTPVLVALLGLAACGPLVQIGGNDKAPVALLTLRATAGAATPARNPSATLSVVTPLVAGPLQTLRLPVITKDTELAYLTGATWAEQPAKQFARVLADTIGARGVTILDARQSAVGATRQLAGTLVDFGVDARGSAGLAVVVRYDALLTGNGGRALGVRRFDGRAAIASNDPAVVGAALNVVANQVAGEVADWVGQ